MWLVKPTEKRHLGRPRRRWEPILEWIKEIFIDTRNWVDSAKDRNYWRVLVKAALNLRVRKAMELVNYCSLLEPEWFARPYGNHELHGSIYGLLVLESEICTCTER